MKLRLIFLASIALSACAQESQDQVPAGNVAAAEAGGSGSWTAQQTQEILARTETIRLAPDISHLRPGERAAVAKLIEVGQIFQDVYEMQRHPQALAARAKLAKDSDEATLYRLFQGPIATTLDNQRVPFLAGRRGATGQKRLSARPHHRGI